MTLNTAQQQDDLAKHPSISGRFTVNLVANILNFALNILIGLWFTPYLVHHLGIAAFGLIPLATTVTSYLGLFTTSLNGAVGRFLMISLTREDYRDANRIFNTSFVGSAIIVTILLIPAVALAFRANLIFNVPIGYEHQFVWLFLCTIGMFALTTLGNPFGLSTFTRNRFDLTNTVSILSNLFRVGTVVVLFSLMTPSVWHIGLGMLAAAITTVTGSVLLWRLLTPMLHFRPWDFSWATLKQLTGMGVWMVVNQVGSLLYIGIDLIVVNKVIGPEAGGHYGAVMTWSTMLRGFASIIAGVFEPTILMLYARHDMMGLMLYARQAVKFLGLVIALPIGLICGLSRPLLHVWLGPNFESLAPLMSLMTIHLCVNLGILPLFNIQVATNTVRLPGIVTCVMGLLNLGLAILLAGPLGWGVYGVAAAGALMLTLKNLLFTPIYTAHILGLGYGTFFRETVPIIIASLSITGAGWLITRFAQVYSRSGLLLAGAVISFAYLAGAYALLLNGEERAVAKRLLRLAPTT